MSLYPQNIVLENRPAVNESIEVSKAEIVFIRGFCYTLIAMKILLIGDTHGRLSRVRDIWPKLKEIDLIAHTGDHYSDAAKLEEEFGVPVIAVGGNCDSSGPAFQIIESDYGRILLTHGHRDNVKWDLDTLKYRTQEQNCRAVFFGHTHQSLNIEEDGIHFVNPGSLSLPRDNSSGSYAIVRTSEDRFEASIVFYSTVMGNKKPPAGGLLKSLLNYSDRF